MARDEDIGNLYIIGNGFDLHHKIQCKYPDFLICQISLKNRDLANYKQKL